MVLAGFAFTGVSAAESPYAGEEAREIKALSRSVIDDYLSGQGMGYAKAAELNHYPGPKHVLDLAGQLGLTPEQTTQTVVLHALMKESAINVGKDLVAKERELDRMFALGSMTSDRLEELLSEIGALEAKLRFVHLNAHLEQKALLTQHQIRLYDKLRGYGATPGAGHDHGH